MITGFYVTKLGMKQVYREDGTLLGVTECLAKSAKVIGFRTQEKDGYSAVVLSFGKQVKEVRVDNNEGLPQLNTELVVENIINPGDLIKVAGTMKGRGFAGVIKRWKFHSQPATHGQSDRERAPGSIGTQEQGRVVKGRKMPGHYGNSRISTLNIEVVSVDPTSKKILINGSIPGYKGSTSYIEVIGKKKNFIPLDKPNKTEGNPVQSASSQNETV